MARHVLFVALAGHGHVTPAPPRRGRRCLPAVTGRPRGSDRVVRRELGQPGAVTEPAQHQHGLPVAAQRPPPASRALTTALGGQQAGHEGHGGFPDREHGGVGDRIGHSRTSVRLDICGRTSLLPRSCVPRGHLPALGVSRLTRQFPTGKGSLSDQPCWIFEPDGLLGGDWSRDQRSRQRRARKRARRQGAAGLSAIWMSARLFQRQAYWRHRPFPWR
jgi:hypothetical protein